MYRLRFYLSLYPLPEAKWFYGHMDKSAYIVKMGLIEAPAFFSIVVFLLTGNLWLLIQIIAVLLVMIINRPTADQIVNELGLERSQIQDIKELNSF